MKIIIYLIILPVISVSVGCKKDLPYKSHVNSSRKISNSTERLDIPADLIEKIDHVFLDSASDPTATAAPAIIELAGLRVYLNEKTKGVMNGKNWQLDFSEGGGELDLRDYLSADKAGSFWIAMELSGDQETQKNQTHESSEASKEASSTSSESSQSEQEKQGSEHSQGSSGGGGEPAAAPASEGSGVAVGALRVFYLSDARSRKLEHDEEVGAGCNRYFDISSTFQKAMKDEGFWVHTAQGRHVSALAGTYFLVQRRGDKLFMSALRLFDSRFPRWHCRRASRESPS